MLINQFIRQLLQSIVVVSLSSLFTVITTFIVNTSPKTANPSKNQLIRSVLPQSRTNDLSKVMQVGKPSFQRQYYMKDEQLEVVCYEKDLV